MSFTLFSSSFENASSVSSSIPDITSLKTYVAYEEREVNPVPLMRFFIFTIFLFIFFNSGYAKNSFLVAPTKIIVNLDKPSVNTFIVINNGDQNIRVTAQPIYFENGSASLPLGENLFKEKGDYDNLAKYIKVSPPVVSLKKGQKRQVRVAIRPLKNIPKGEYRAHILFKMLETSH